MAALRLRQRYRELIYELIAETVSGPAEVEEEVRFLLAAVSP
jgi:predicted ATPase